MRLDHIAYRVKDRDKTVKFLMDAFNYRFQAEFEIFFNDEKTDKALCIALEPPEKIDKEMPWIARTAHLESDGPELEYHLAPELFVSEGTPGSIVGEWVKKRDGIGGIHHVAYQVESVEKTMKEWQERGLADFTSQEPMTCDDLVQVFSKYHPLTGVIYEFIQRKEFGFCSANVKALMLSTKGD